MSKDCCRARFLHGRWWRRAAAGALLLAATTARAGAQAPDFSSQRAKFADSIPADSLAHHQAQQALKQPHSVRWYEAGAVLGGVALVSVLDEPLQRTTQDHRSGALGDVATVFRQQGEPWYYGGLSLGVFAAGVVANSPDLRRAGRRLVATVAVSGLTTYAIKYLAGRSRPNDSLGAFSFHPFSSRKDAAGKQARGAFPSGHAAEAFAVATSLADDIRNPLATVVLYTVATGAAWSRIYDNRHWLSDTLFGAALGFTTSKVVSGHWHVFGWRPPAFMVRPTGDLAVGWNLPF